MKYVVMIASFIILIDLMIRIIFFNKKTKDKDLKRTKNLLENGKFPSNKNEAYEKEEKLLNKANVNMSVERFQKIKLITSLLVLLMSFTILFSYQNIKKAEILNKKSVALNIIGTSRSVEDTDIFLIELTKEASENLHYKEIIKGGEIEELQVQVYNLVKSKGLDKEQILAYTQDVYKNLKKLNDTRLKAINCLMILLISLAFLNLPKLIVVMKVKRMESAMEEELNKLEIFTLLLLKKENINIYQVIAKLYEKADILKPYFLKCLNNYQRDGKGALEDMQEEVDFKPFTDFVNILKQGIDTNKRTTANVLEISRRLRNSIRTAQIRDRNKKKHRNIIIVRFPMIVVGLYMLVLPLLIVLRENM